MPGKSVLSMAHDVLTIRRRMGSTFSGLAARDDVLVRDEPSWWAALTELPAPDANMVLIHEDEPAAVREALDLIGSRGFPALFMLAGAAEPLGAKLPPEWSHAGAMPVMTKELHAEVDDPRVRAATLDDVPVCGSLMERAFGLPRDVAGFFAEAWVPSDGTFWVLEDGGEPVSAVFAHQSEDSVSIWCMCTPPEHQRKGHGRALLGAALARAAADGATWGILGATEAGYPLYEATGWQVADEWQIYLNGDSEQFG